MSKHLRIWLFVLLSTLLTSTSLLAEGVITMTTSKPVGSMIDLIIEANGNVTIEGVKEKPRLGWGFYTLSNQTVTIRGNVTSLDCSNKQLTSLVVSGCTSLTKLDCLGNNLTSLNISGCTSLTTLNCSYNQLTNLNVSDCTALKKLNCYGNQLTNFNVSSYPTLSELNCGGNQLTNLNVSGHSALTKLFCHKNKLTTLDVSDCASLIELYCVTNQLTSLDVSNCPALTELSCIENQLTSLDASSCTALTVLGCGDNQLISLDVSSCTNLTSLYCANNLLTNLNLSDHKALTTLNCHNNFLRKIELAGCTSLVSLTCHMNQIKVREMANLVNSLPDLGSKVVGAFRVFYDGGYKDDGNVCLAAHVATAQAKGWKTQFTRDRYGLLTWNDYTGADNPVYAVTSLSIGGGSISLTGADNLNAVPYGTTLTIVSTPADGYKLTKLTANGQDILETMRFKVTEKTEVKATFTLQAYNVTTIKLGKGTLYVFGADNLEAVTPGTELTITAEPAEDYKLIELTANGKSILDTKKVVVNEDLIIRAIFSNKKTFAVTFDKVGEGTITATGASDLNAVAYGTELTIVATPVEGYELTALTANGSDILASKKVVVTDNVSVKAIFEKKTFAVTLTSNEHGDITIVEPVDLKAVPYGTTLTVKATGKNAQCELTALTANGVDILATKSFVVKGATEVKAMFVGHTGVETTVTQQVQLYPNPATDYVIVEGVAPASEVTLHSMTGERLYAGRADSRGVLQIDLTPYADGVYLVCVAGETYRVVVRR